MARIVKEYAVRRNEILDVAQRLIYTKSYEQMTIQDILNELQMSKGGFFHYFDSKQDLLEAVIERMLEEGQKLMDPILQDPDLPALDKLHRMLDTGVRWKTARKQFIIALLRIWYADENAIVRQKMSTAGAKWAVPMMTSIVRQGIAEGVFNPAHPEQVGEVILTLMQGIGDGFANLIFTAETMEDAYPGDELSRRLEGLVAAYTDTLERVIGVPPGTIQMMDAETIREWSQSIQRNEVLKE